MNQLTVFYENSFWVGVFEEKRDGEISVCKVTFGAEPKGEELLNFVDRYYFKLKFSDFYAEDEACIQSVTKRINPKRLQRLVSKEMNQVGISTKSQEAIRAERESQKKVRLSQSKAFREQQLKLKFAKKQKQKKEKKKGH
ncbi:YjdF family protein [Fusibacter ferrireducens]|uniref:YjdF family protein n=1 Tax=Fusibacter ferrireducens TaxID=2785058 RepID=A0ABR9ZRT4_9FIRM|nr:YjdF family protein [Fusibacter ferrireducens]MBF4692686.1 YjdF family protein [Fusibacter ferrireducens]